MARIVALSLGVLIYTIASGYFLLPKIKTWGYGQRVREDGPQSHLAKTGTPTFGGLFFIFAWLVFLILRTIIFRVFDSYTVSFLLIFAYGLVGFWDDYTKVKIDREGISPKQKAISLGLISLVFAIYYLYFADLAPFFYLPFSGKIIEITGWFKPLYLVFVILYLFYMSNSVNLSDGVDGLCSSLVLVSAITLSLVLYKQNWPGNLPLVEVLLVIAAGVLGFLVYNKHPAKIFMGDTGSLALGVGLAVVALWAGIPWIMLLNGIVFVVEGMSSILQTLYFKATKGKRLFRMAPLHHHYELGGWSENKIVIIFSLVGLIAGLLALLFI